MVALAAAWPVPWRGRWGIAGLSFIERTAVNTGTVLVPPEVPTASGCLVRGSLSADRVRTGRSRRSTPRPGEPVTPLSRSVRSGGSSADETTALVAVPQPPHGDIDPGQAPV
jgi:hypothetical protein